MYIVNVAQSFELYVENSSYVELKLDNKKSKDILVEICLEAGLFVSIRKVNNGSL